MKLAVIITAYNRPKLLSACLDSLLVQTDSNWQAYIGDDNSSSAEQVQIIADFFRQRPDTVLYRSDVTQAERPQKCRYAVLINQLVPHVPMDDLLIFLCDDTELLPHAVETIRKHFQDHPDHGAGYIGQRLVNADFKTGAIDSEGQTVRGDEGFGKPLGTAFCRLDHSQVVHRRSVFSPWSENYNDWPHADGLAFDHIARNFGPLYPIGDVLHDPLCIYKVTETSVCRQPIEAALEKLRDVP